MASALFIMFAFSIDNIHCSDINNIVKFNILNMETFADRLRWALEKKGVNQSDLARAVGVNRATINFWINGKTKEVEGSNLSTAANYLGVSALWLSTGKGPKSTGGLAAMYAGLEPNTSPGPDIHEKRTPVISWVQAGTFCSSPDLFQPGDAEEWKASHKGHGPHTFILRVRGDSMVSPYPGQRSYPEGTLIYVDPDKPVTNKCRVVARIHDAEEATFKEYVEDAGVRYLKPLNPQYPTIQMDETMHICGVVVQATMEE